MISRRIANSSAREFKLRIQHIPATRNYAHFRKANNHTVHFHEFEDSENIPRYVSGGKIYWLDKKITLKKENTSSEKLNFGIDSYCLFLVVRFIYWFEITSTNHSTELNELR